MIKTLLTISVLVGAGGSVSAYADCTFAAGYSANTVEAISFGTVIVPPATPVGTVVASKTSTVISQRDYFIAGCTTFNQQDWRDPALPAVAYAGQTLYQSGVAGYAIRIVTPGAGSTSGRFGAGSFPRILSGTPCRSWPSAWDYCGGSWGPVTFQLVKISATAGTGPLSGGTLVRASLRGWNWLYTANLSSSSIVNPTCTVASASIQVPLGNVERRTFSGPGSTSPAKNFSIPLRCAVGARVSFRLDATAVGSAAPGVIALDTPATGSRAQGIGVQILHTGTPVKFATAIVAGIASAAGAYNVPFTARYYQTAAGITAGTANAHATFTMTYN